METKKYIYILRFVFECVGNRTNYVLEQEVLSDVPPEQLEEQTLKTFISQVKSKLQEDWYEGCRSRATLRIGAALLEKKYGKTRNWVKLNNPNGEPVDSFGIWVPCDATTSSEMKHFFENDVAKQIRLFLNHELAEVKRQFHVELMQHLKDATVETTDYVFRALEKVHIN